MFLHSSLAPAPCLYSQTSPTAELCQPTLCPLLQPGGATAAQQKAQSGIRMFCRVCAGLPPEPQTVA